MLDQFCNVFSYAETVLLATVLRMLALQFPLSPLLLCAWHHKGHMTQCEAIHQTCEVLCANTDTKAVLSMDYWGVWHNCSCPSVTFPPYPPTWGSNCPSLITALHSHYELLAKSIRDQDLECIGKWDYEGQKLSSSFIPPSCGFVCRWATCMLVRLILLINFTFVYQ